MGNKEERNKAINKKEISHWREVGERELPRAELDSGEAGKIWCVQCLQSGRFGARNKPFPCLQQSGTTISLLLFYTESNSNLNMQFSNADVIAPPIRIQWDFKGTLITFQGIRIFSTGLFTLLFTFFYFNFKCKSLKFLLW